MSPTLLLVEVKLLFKFDIVRFCLEEFQIQLNWLCVTANLTVQQRHSFDLLILRNDLEALLHRVEVLLANSFDLAGDRGWFKLAQEAHVQGQYTHPVVILRDTVRDSSGLSVSTSEQLFDPISSLVEQHANVVELQLRLALHFIQHLQVSWPKALLEHLYSTLCVMLK